MIRLGQWACALMLLVGHAAWAWTSDFPSLYFRGTANQWQATPMALVADHRWQLTVDFATGDSNGGPRFKVDVTGNWSWNYGDNGGDGVLDVNGADIQVAANSRYLIEVNDQTKALILTKVASVNLPPTADAGPDQRVAVGTLVQFDGTGSIDSDGAITNYQWSNGLSGATPALRYDAAGSYPITLTVTDNQGATATDVMLLTVDESPTFAHNWPQLYLRGTFNSWTTTAMTLVADHRWQLTATFAESGSRFKFDVNGDWGQNYGDSNGDGVAERSGGDIGVVPGSYIITINETDLSYSVVAATLSNQPPVANAGSDLQVMVGDSVQFDGSASIDPDGEIVSYQWSNGLSGERPTKVYSAAGTYLVTLTVTDDQGATASDSLTVEVQEGTPQLTKNFDQVYLRGTNNGWSSSPMALVADHSWQLDTVFDGSASARFKFDIYGDWSHNYGDSNKDGIADLSGSDIAVSAPVGDYRITFNDSTLKYQVVAVVINHPPTADAGPDQVVIAGSEVIFDGRGSTDSDGDIVSYHWSNGLVGASPSLLYPEPGVYEVTLTVTDSGGLSAEDSMVVTVVSDSSAACASDIGAMGDSDDDGLPDCAELPGVIYGGEEFYLLGARLGQRDFFIEIDWMDSSDLGVIPQREALVMVRDAFARHGVSLHIDVGSLYHSGGGISPDDFDLGGGNAVPFSPYISISTNGDANTNLPSIRAANMAATRRLRTPFYYLLFASSQQPDGSAGSSGVAWVRGRDAIVTLGQWGLNRNSETATNLLINYQAGTLMHEYGHNLGFFHGGGDSVNNKPNYLSVMNYSFQLSGLPPEGATDASRFFSRRHNGDPSCGAMNFSNLPYGPNQDYRQFRIDYSSGESIALNENLLSEVVGLGRPQSTAQDFNCNGVIDGGTVAVEMNLDGQMTTLADYNDWQLLRHFFASSLSGLAPDQRSEVVSDETPPSAEFFDQLRELMN